MLFEESPAKSEVIRLRVTPDEKQAVIDAAERRGMSLSRFLRFAISAVVSTRTHRTHMIGEIQEVVKLEVDNEVPEAIADRLCKEVERVVLRVIEEHRAELSKHGLALLSEESESSLGPFYVYLNYGERLVARIEILDDSISKERLVQGALVPAVEMRDRKPEIVSFSLIPRTRVDTRPEKHLGEVG